MNKTINSLDNIKIKGWAKLKNSRQRNESGRFLIDGAREIIEAQKAGIIIEQFIICSELFVGKNILADFPENKTINVSARVFHKLAYKENPDGYLAIAKIPEKSMSSIKITDKLLIILLEAVEKPGNIGAIIRTAYAAGVNAVILDNCPTDIYNPNIIRASEGKVFLVPVIKTDREDIKKWLIKNKIKVFATATDASEEYWQVDFSGKSAIVLGSEADGLSPFWRQVADQNIIIPMKKGIDSLNVSVSAALLMFEAVRQRVKTNTKI